mmetsp:Transcript_278/g.402  ORF Transcript_278/g.402 Transcript_278/m.402 type:complete len:366 (+) Transcript_278:939-2036(+)
MHLRQLVGEHVAVVVVCCHAKPAVSPHHELHGGGVGEEVRELRARRHDFCLYELRLVVSVEHLLHDLPERLLPLEHRLFGHHVRRDACSEAPAEENPRQMVHIVVRVVVRHHSVLRVHDIALVHNDRLGVSAPLGDEGSSQLASASELVPRRVFAPYRVPLEKYRVFVTKLHPIDVDGVARYSNSVPPATHRAVGRPPRLLQPQTLHLPRCGSDGGLLENGLELVASRNDVAEHLVLGVVAILGAQVIEIPLAGIHVRMHPLVQHQLHCVPCHLLAGHVHHGRGGDLVNHGRGAGRGREAAGAHHLPGVARRRARQHPRARGEEAEHHVGGSGATERGRRCFWGGRRRPPRARKSVSLWVGALFG